MRIRDALESDAEALADATDRPADVLVDTVHDRTVRVAIDDRDGDEIDGFVAFDVRAGTVHVTDLAGTRPALERLIEEPKRFARREGMDVEAVVVDGEERRADALEAAGFAAAGSGPRFEGRATTRFRLGRDE
ncbi:hypothetical protein [Halorubrum cibi]|uniref:N-acetyltransferase domain-containing protein n=1 Tax=Halorubrum cibi TaxID=413815 RepID=A0A521AAK6_9EURY|nr:hypothetical protein [Halorubrum cibi]SMO31816.1 hypothetical protein SAMN06264867_10112 [Halorubrum cibi]